MSRHCKRCGDCGVVVRIHYGRTAPTHAATRLCPACSDQPLTARPQGYAELPDARTAPLPDSFRAAVYDLDPD